MPSRRPANAPLFAAQFADGAGAKFHTVALSLYVLTVAGIGSMSGFIASGLLGSVAAVAVAAVAARALPGRTVMAAAAVTLLGSRVGAYALVAADVPVWCLAAGQFVGSLAGTVLISCSKAQAPASARAKTLAWMGLANGAGGIVGAAAAGAFSAGWPTWLLVTVGSGGALISTAPMLALSKRTVSAPVALRTQLAAFATVAGPVTLGGVVFACVGGFDLLRNGLVTETFSASWVGTLTGVSVAGAWLATLTVGRFQEVTSDWSRSVLWPTLGGAPLLLWAFADGHVAVMAAAVSAGGLTLGWLAVSVEAVVLDRAGAAGPAALTMSGSAASLLSAATVSSVPALTASGGFPRAAAAMLTVLAGAAGITTAAAALSTARRTSLARTAAC